MNDKINLMEQVYMRYYLKKIFEYYSTPKIVIYQLVISTGLVILDYLNYPSIYFEHNFFNENTPILLIIFGALIAVLILFGIEFKLYEVFKMPVINRLDYFNVIAIYNVHACQDTELEIFR